MADTLTLNYRFVLTTYNTVGWDTKMNNNLIAVDAILAQFNAGINLQGLWVNAHPYTAGQSVVDGVTGQVWACGVSHTSSTSPTTFLQDRTSNPTFWTNITNPAATAAQSATAAAGSAASAAASAASVIGAWATPGTIGSTTPNSGSFTTLTANNDVNFNQASHNISIAPTGTGTLTVNPATASTMNNTSVGITTPQPGKFTTLAATGLISPASGVGILGDNAVQPAGSKGELKTNANAGGAIANNTTTNLTSIVLGRGNWIAWYDVAMNAATAGQSMQQAFAAISTVTASLSGAVAGLQVPTIANGAIHVPVFGYFPDTGASQTIFGNAFGVTSDANNVTVGASTLRAIRIS